MGQEEIERCKEKYITQKGVTNIMVGNKKSGWEAMKIQETENDPELFWRMIKMLLGKEKVDNEEAFIFDDRGEKQEIMECKTEFLSKWITQVYQRLEKADFSFWKDNEGGCVQKLFICMGA